MKEIVVISGKGGTGKTSFLASFAALSKNAIIADCDVDASNLHIILDPELIREESVFGSFEAKISGDICTECGLCRDACRFGAIDEDFNVAGELCEGCGVCELVCPANAVELCEKSAGMLRLSKSRFGYFSHVKMNSGEEGSGKLVTAVRDQARRIAKENGIDKILIDGPPGIGCPVIASTVNTDLAVIVTEPSLSGMHDLVRVHGMLSGIGVNSAICINKYDINPDIAKKIGSFADSNSIPLVGKVPYSLDFVDSMLKAKSIVELGSSPMKDNFKNIWQRIESLI